MTTSLTMEDTFVKHDITLRHCTLMTTRRGPIIQSSSSTFVCGHDFLAIRRRRDVLEMPTPKPRAATNSSFSKDGAALGLGAIAACKSHSVHACHHELRAYLTVSLVRAYEKRVPTTSLAFVDDVDVLLHWHILTYIC